ncbi:fatty acid-binding protein DegV [Rothia sp. HMSC066H02]|uniref:DegV family protein n=1 Tax=unclassified Rothia (in: high G+C Gram-positive bacteria) TaxID=2689056 RepID=UPI0008A3A3F1|nr:MULTISPECIES: DegV family protein [unclassified Rothia (in: high G+C Gram-positive bacteria)]OFO97095.1 fatty acid-binding protein DegV [Rothia sp. HMSC065D09]OFP11829.1 fatty acid-binding protein DegV [Rothia sp. HMSC066H02]
MERENKAENRIAVVTDSAAALDPELVQRLSARGNFALVPMPVTIRTPGAPDRQLQDLTAAEVDEAIMLAHVMGQTVSTSGPAPGVFADVYDELASRGFTHVVSVHLSGELSGTVEAARTGARLSRLGSEGVSVVDSRTVAGAYGHAVVRALEVLNSASAGASVECPSPAQLVDYIQSVCEQSTLYFYIPTLDALRRGGRVSPALAMVGQMFQIKPIGTITEGKLAYVERPRTAARALERLVEVTVQTCREHQHAAALSSASVGSTAADPASSSLAASPRGEVVAVHHVGNAAQAVQLYEQVQQMLGESSLGHDSVASSAPEFLVSALPPVLSAHSGLGAVALVVY